MFTISYLVLFVVTSNDFQMDLSAVVLADSQGKYFDQYVEEHNILTLFHSGDRIKDLLKKGNITGCFKIVIIQIRSKDTCNDDTSTMLHNM